MLLLALACFSTLCLFGSGHQMLPYVVALHGVMWLLIFAGFITDKINDSRFLRLPSTPAKVIRYFELTWPERYLKLIFPIVAIVSIAAPLSGS